MENNEKSSVNDINEVNENNDLIGNQNEALDSRDDEKAIFEEQNPVDTSANNVTDKVVEPYESYAGYNIFVFISAIIGFITVFFLTRLTIDWVKVKRGIDLTQNKLVISIAVAVVSVILFMFISLSFKKFLKKIYLSELFLYLYMGVLTTAVNIISYEVIRNILLKNNPDSGLVWKVAEIFAFVIAVIFAFVTNKIFVFKSFTIVPIKLFYEFSTFIGARIVTELINVFIMWLMIDKNHMDEFISKVVASVFVIISNYIFSKFLIFRKKKDSEKN